MKQIELTFDCRHEEINGAKLMTLTWESGITIVADFTSGEGCRTDRHGKCVDKFSMAMAVDDFMEMVTDCQEQNDKVLNITNIEE